MMSRAEQVRYGAHAWNYAVALSIRTLPEGPEREALIACEGRLAIANIRVALAICHHRPWLPLIKSAMVEIGLAAMDDILKKADHDHRT